MRRTLASLLVLLVSGCTSTMHWASGTLHYEGHDPSGPFSGDTGATSCDGSFNLAGGAGVQIDGSRRGYVVELGGDPAPAVIVGAQGAMWILRRESCSVFDAGAVVEDGHIRARVHIDCVSDQGVHVWGDLEGSNCRLRRP